MNNAKNIWQNEYDKHFMWHNLKWLSPILCFFGSHKMMPLDEMANNIKCEYCSKKERFYPGCGYY